MSATPAANKAARGATPERPAQLVREQAFETLKHAIISGRLKPGARLVERELCATLGVSRGVVREAVRRLEAERLVTVAAHCGPRVEALTAKTAREIYELRADLEVMLTRDFIRNASAAQRDAVAALSNDVAATARNVDAMLSVMQTFYALLMDGADNATAADILNALHARISRLRVLAMSEPGRMARSVGEISAVITAIAQRDAHAAEAATRAYVAAARDAALRQIGTD